MNEPLKSNLIRQYSDGELSEEQSAQVEQYLQDHPEDKAIVDSERKLRSSIKTALIADCPNAPAGLEDKIKADFANESQEETYAYSQKAWSFGPNKANVFAVAASIALVIGAVLFGIFGNPIDRPNMVVSRASEAAESVGMEHIYVATTKGCLEDMAGSGCNNSASARKEYCTQLGSDNLPKIDLSLAGYEFKNGMKCEVPHCETSYHLIYRQIKGRGLVSIHIARDKSKNLDLEDGGEPFESKTPLITSRFYLDQVDMGSYRPCVIAFRDSEFMYLVMTCIPKDTEQVINLIQASIVDQGR